MPAARAFLVIHGALAMLTLVATVACGGTGHEETGSAQSAVTVCDASSSTLQGVDVSSHDGTIDWATVKASGRSFAFVKATEGTTFVDPTFTTNWAGTRQNGLVRGASHFFHASLDPVAEANHFLTTVGALAADDLPPILDLEVTDSQTGATITANAITFLDTVAAATGRTPILYISPGFATATLGSPSAFQKYSLWVANWGVACPDVPAPWTTWMFWQYADTGTVPGIAGTATTDVDIFNGSLSQLQAFISGSVLDAGLLDGGDGGSNGGGDGSIGSDSGAGDAGADSGASADAGTGSDVETEADSGSDDGSDSDVPIDSSAGDGALIRSVDGAADAEGDAGDAGTGAGIDAGSGKDAGSATDSASATDASDNTGNRAGCGCRTVQTNEAAPWPAVLAFGAIALLGSRRLRRGPSCGIDRQGRLTAGRALRSGR